MASYNAWNGMPMTVNPILKDMVAGEWGVNGIVTTDAGAVHNMVTKHRYFPDMTQAVAACVKIGVNQFLDGYRDGLNQALETKAISEKDIDAALRGKFRVVLRLGLLDPPALVPYAKSDSAAEPWQSDAHKAVALQVARESIVLLKNAPMNSARLLPVGPRTKSNPLPSTAHARTRCCWACIAESRPTRCRLSKDFARSWDRASRSTWAPGS